MIRVVVIGVGHWHAARHIDALRYADAQVVGVSEREAAVADRWGRAKGCPAFVDDQALLDRTHPDFAIVLPRHADAPAAARHVIERGIPFAIEKPLGLTADDVAPLVKLIREHGLFTAVPFINRYSAIWAEVARLRAEGLLDPLAHAHFRLVNGPPNRYVQDGVGWMLDPAVSGGGALRNLGIHAVDAFRQLTGEPVEVVAASTSRQIYQLAIEEFGTAMLRTPSGVVATIEAGYTHADPEGSDREWRIAGRGGYLVEHSGRLQTGTRGGTSTRTVPTTADHYRGFAADTLQRFTRGEPAIADVEDCYDAMRVLDQIYAKADEA